MVAPGAFYLIQISQRTIFSWNSAIEIVIEVTGIKKMDEAAQYLRELAKETGLIGQETGKRNRFDSFI